MRRTLREIVRNYDSQLDLFLVYSIKSIIFLATAPTQAMTRAKTVNLDINQRNVSVYSRTTYSRANIRQIGAKNFDVKR